MSLFNVLSPSQSPTPTKIELPNLFLFGRGPRLKRFCKKLNRVNYRTFNVANYRYDENRHKKKTCTYNQNEVYVVFSATGSFFAPLIVMLYVYAKISRVIARRHTTLRVLNQPTRRVIFQFLLNDISRIQQITDKRACRRRARPLFVPQKRERIF